MSEQQPLLPQSGDNVEGHSRDRQSLRQRTAKKLQTKTFHVAVISLVILDTILVLVDLSYTYLSNNCTSPKTNHPFWVGVLSQISLVITILFLIELFTFIWAFGPSYYSPLRSVLHFCDGSIIVLTFVVDVVLKGRKRELASLLIVFRLLRFAGEAAVGVGEWDEDNLQDLEQVKKDVAEKTKALEEAKREIQALRAKISALSPGA